MSKQRELKFRAWTKAQAEIAEHLRKKQEEEEAKKPLEPGTRVRVPEGGPSEYGHYVGPMAGSFHLLSFPTTRADVPMTCVATFTRDQFTVIP